MGMSDPVEDQTTVVRSAALSEGDELPCKRQDILDAEVIESDHLRIWYVEPLVQLKEDWV